MYGGSVLSISTVQRAQCVITSSERLQVASSGAEADIENADDLQLRGDLLDIPRAALQWFDVSPDSARFRLELSTEIPMQAGMAGSTALVVSAVGALDRWLGLALTPWAIAETARKIEYRIMGVLCGLQDQHMAVFGGLNFMDFAGKESLEQADDEPLATVEPLAPHIEYADNLLLAHTGVAHHSGAVHKSPRQRWLEGDPLVRQTYSRLAELARRAKRAWLEGDWLLVGALMNENHSLVAALGGSGPENERLIDAARKAGAHGAKLAGAGGGGTIVALADDIDRIGGSLLAAGADSLMRPAPCPGLTVTGNP
jgi:galactokinase/mevalonate kinase-like predicted kinase